MSIVTSTYAVGHAQPDGRKYVVESHTDDVGQAYRVEYLAAVGTDYGAVMTARAAQINDQLAEAEAQALIDNGS